MGQGRDMTPEERDGWIQAAIAGDLAKIKEIAGTGINIDQEDAIGTTALIRAAAGGHMDLVRYLVEEQKADVNAGQLMTPLHIAINNRKRGVAEYLLDHGADIFKTTEGELDTPLDVARAIASDDGAAYIDLLLSHLTPEEKRREFFKAAQPETALPEGLNDSNGNIRYSYSRILAGFARDRGFDLDMKLDGSTALHLLAPVPYAMPFLHALVTGGARLMAKDAQGHTAEQIARAAGNNIIADYLGFETFQRDASVIGKELKSAVEAPQAATFRKRRTPGL